MRCQGLSGLVLSTCKQLDPSFNLSRGLRFRALGFNPKVISEASVYLPARVWIDGEGVKHAERMIR